MFFFSLLHVYESALLPCLKRVVFGDRSLVPCRECGKHIIDRFKILKKTVAILLTEPVESLSRHERYRSKAKDVLAFICICIRSQLEIEDEIVGLPISLFICETANTEVTVEELEFLVQMAENYSMLVIGYK